MKKSIFPALFTAIAAAISMHAIVWAQQAGTNMNVLPSYPIGHTFPIPLDPVTHLPITTSSAADNLKGDNFLQRQGEPTIAASSYNADHLLTAFNDYRQVDFANDTGLSGTAAAQGWLGYARSYDRGKHWYGAMFPGFPGGTSPADLNSPVRGMSAGSDPTVTTTPGGHFYLGGLFYVPNGPSAIAVMHLRDVPSLDGGDSITPGKITVIDRGSQSANGNFEDKPAFASDVTRGTTDPNVCGPVYAAYTTFVGGSATVPFVSKIAFTRSKQGKCGEAWDTPQYINKTYKQNQGVAIAVHPISGKIYVAWRHIFQPGGDGFPDSILIASSTDGGSTFSAPVPISGPDFVPYDQISIDSNVDPNHMAFRSSAFPSLAVDGFGNVYAAIQEKVAFGPPAPAGYNEPRVVIRSLRAGSNQWAKGYVEANPTLGGQQVMPSLAFSAGLLKVAWYDFRRPESFPNDTAWGLPSTCDNAGNCYIAGLDRRMETRLAQLTVNNLAGLSFAPSVPVTQYGSKTFAGRPAANRPNLPLYVGGTTAFTGDYLAIAPASPFVANPAGSNPPFRWATQTTDITALPSLTAWTDSRDIVFPLGGSGQPDLSVANINGWRSYAPPGAGLASCVNPGSRNQNVYFSEVKTGLIAGSPATSRQLVDGAGLPFERAFPFYVQNTTPRNKFFRVSFQQDSTAARGSFVQGTAKTASQPPPPIDVTIGPFSTISKTVYAYCASCTRANAFARFSIKVDEIASLGGAKITNGLTTQLRFNSDSTAPFVTNEKLANQEIHAVSFSSADWASADWASADWASADWASADWASADWASADWASADWASADWASADWASADWASADWASMAPVGDLVSKASNIGNNASSYSVAVNINPALAADLKAKGFLAGLFITRSYNASNSFTGCAIQPIPLEHIISVIPLELSNLQTTVLDTAAFSAVPSTNTPLAAGNSSGAAEVQPDNVYVVLRLFGKRTGTLPPPPLSLGDQATLIANTTTTVSPQAGDTVAGKQAATVTLSNLSQVYTGGPLTPTVTTSPAGLTVVFSGAPQTNVRTYPVLATINDPSYQGSAAATFSITPAASTTTVSCPASVTYNGSAQTPCSASASGAGGLSQPLLVSYSNNTNAGPATANAAYAGDGNHTGSNGSKTFSIAKAPVTATAGSGSSAYDGAAHAPSACVVVGAYTGDLSCANSPASVGPTAGTTTVAPVVSGTSVGNFNVTQVNGSFTISQTSSTTTVTCPSGVTYNGSAQTPCSVSVTGSGGLTLTPTPSYTNNTDAGTATASYTYAGDGNHTGSSDSKTFEIAKAPVTATAGSGSSTYDGLTHAPSACVVVGAYTGDLSCANSPASVGPAKGTTTITPVVSGAGVGNFAITPVNGSYTIDQAPSTTTVTCPAGVIYNGSPQTPCSATVTGAGGLDQPAAVSYSNNRNAGIATASASYAGDANHSGSSDSKTFLIGKANASCAVSGYSVTYDGNPHTATGSCIGVGADGTLTGLDLSGTTHTAVGDYPADPWSFTDATGNYNNAGGTVHDTIAALGTILVYGPALDSGTTPNEATLASAAGYTVVTKNDAEWAALTTSDFAAFKALVFPDPNCAATPSPTLDTALATRATWSPAVTGRKVVVGTDPLFHSRVGTAAARALMLNGVKFAASGPATGMYMSLSCYYSSAATATPVPLLDQFGGFSVTGWDLDQVNINDPSSPVVAGLSNADLSNWGNSVHQVFNSFPPTWTVVASETTSGSRPYILVNNGTILVYGPGLASAITPNEATIAASAGYTVVTKTASEWAAMSTTAFASFNAIVFPDPNCVASPSPTLDAAEANRITWSPAVTGPKVVIGTDPLYHDSLNIGAQTLMTNGVTFAARGSTTGMYISLSCYYSGAVTSTAVTVLDQFGSFMVSGLNQDPVDIVAPGHAVMAGLTNATLGGWHQSVHEVFDSFPATWKALATATGVGIQTYIIADR